MPTLGENKYRDNSNTFIDDARNYKRKSIDEQDDYSIVEELLYLNEEKKNIQNTYKENLFVNVELGSTRTSAIGLNFINNNNNRLEKKNNESKNINNYNNYNDKNDKILESPLNELQRYQLTLLKKSNPSCPKQQTLMQDKKNIEREEFKNIKKYEEEKNRGKNENSNINISIKGNNNECNNSIEVKMHKHDLMITPRKNYNEFYSKEMKDNNKLNDQKVMNLKNIDIQEIMKSGNFINNQRIKGSSELKKSDSTYYQNASSYDEKIKRTNSKSRGCDNENINNNFNIQKKTYKTNEESIHVNASKQYNEKHKIVSDSFVDNLDNRINSFKCKDNMYEDHITEEMNQNKVNQKKIKDSYENIDKKKNTGYDNLHKNMLCEISKNSYTMDEKCMIYKRKNFEKSDILKENDYAHFNNDNYKKNSNQDLNNTYMGFSTFYNNTDDRVRNNNKNEIKNVEKNEKNFNMNTHNKNRKLYEKKIDVNKSVEENKDMKALVKKKNIVNTKHQDKNNYYDKTLNNKSCNSTPSKNLSTTRKNLNVSSKIKNDKTIAYITFDEIKDFEYEMNNDHINEMVTELVEFTKDRDWTKQIENLINIRKILKFYNKIFFEEQTKELRKIVRSIVELLNSPRSCVSKNALLCLSEFYSIGKKKTDNTLDDVILPCLKKAHQTSVDFLSSAANNTLLSICNSCSESKLILYFVKLITSKQKTYNLICLRCLIAVIIKFDENIIKFKEINNLIDAILECTAGGSAEIKCTARVALVVLDNIYPIKKLCNKLHIPMEKIRKIEILTEKTSENEIDLVLGKIKFS